MTYQGAAIATSTVRRQEGGYRRMGQASFQCGIGGRFWNARMRRAPLRGWAAKSGQARQMSKRWLWRWRI